MTSLFNSLGVFGYLHPYVLDPKTETRVRAVRIPREPCVEIIVMTIVESEEVFGEMPKSLCESWIDGEVNSRLEAVRRY